MILKYNLQKFIEQLVIIVCNICSGNKSHAALLLRNRFSIEYKGDNCLQNERGEREMTNRQRAIAHRTTALNHFIQVPCNTFIIFFLHQDRRRSMRKVMLFIINLKY